MAHTAPTGAEPRGTGSTLGRATRRLTTEPEQVFKTTEFWAMVTLIVAI